MPRLVYVKNETVKKELLKLARHENSFFDMGNEGLSKELVEEMFDSNGCTTSTPKSFFYVQKDMILSNLIIVD